MPTVVVSAYNVASFPEGGGHFWVYMQYVLALRQLGCDVYWLESFRTKGRSEREDAALKTFRERTRAHGLEGKLIVYRTRSKRAEAEAPTEYLEMPRDEAESVYDRADLLLNFHYAISPGLLARFRRTALVDIDPGLLQFWINRGQLRVPRHDVYFTTGENICHPSGHIPNGNLPWMPIRPAVCLEHWPYVFNPDNVAFTTVSLWDSSDWVVDEHETYENTKRVSFLEFAELPRMTRQPLELALFLRTERDFKEQSTLENRGWRIRQSREVASTPEAYQAYIQQSRGEFSCAKPSCMRFQSAWISDRTLCYLASGKPAVVQHTGPSATLPSREGLFRFTTLREAVEAFETVNGDYERHSRAARRLVETHFDAKQVVKGILSRALS